MKIEKKISSKASLNRGLRSNSENVRLSEPPFCHNVLLFMLVVEGEFDKNKLKSLGRFDMHL
jgi:hypothetical protein